MKTAINEGKTLEKHILWSCTCKFDGRKCYLKEKCSDELCLYECKKKQKKNTVYEEDYTGNPSISDCEYDKDS